MKPAKSRLTAYLSGGMQYAPRRGAEWREELALWLKVHLGHAAIDPVRSSRRLMARMRASGAKLHGKRRRGGDWPAFFRAVVDIDTGLVANRSDYVICLWNTSARRGAGTQGELTVARRVRMPVYLVSRAPIERLPGWIQGCTTRHFGNWTDLQVFLLKRYASHRTKRG